MPTHFSRDEEPRFPQKPQFGPTAPLVHSCSLISGRGRALPPIRWIFDFTVPCQEGNGTWATSQTGEWAHHNFW